MGEEWSVKELTRDNIEAIAENLEYQWKE